MSIEIDKRIIKEVMGWPIYETVITALNAQQYPHAVILGDGEEGYFVYDAEEDDDAREFRPSTVVGDALEAAAKLADDRYLDFNLRRSKVFHPDVWIASYRNVSTSQEMKCFHEDKVTAINRAMLWVLDNRENAPAK